MSSHSRLLILSIVRILRYHIFYRIGLSTDILMRVAGLEPARDCSREILSLLCLPIPPYPQCMKYVPTAENEAFTCEAQMPLSQLWYVNGRRWIRTTEGSASRFTVCPLWPLGNSPIGLINNDYDTIDAGKNQEGGEKNVTTPFYVDFTKTIPYHAFLAIQTFVYSQM